VKHKKLLISLLIVISVTSFVGVSLVMAKEIYFKEPKRPAGLSSDIKWDTKKGEYVLDEDLDEYGRVRSLSSQEDVKPEDITVNPQVAWLAKNKNSTDEIDRAIVSWLEAYDRNLGFRSWYNPDEDIAFQKIMLPLGIKKLPEILERAKTDEAWNGFMMVTFAKISKIKDLEEISLTDEGKVKWFKTLKDKAIAAKTLSSNKLPDTRQVTTKDQLTKETEDLGVLALPYLSNQVKSDNENALDSISLLTSKDPERIKNDSEDVKAVEELIETIVNNY
jgi:hypothetical protein